MAEGSGDIGEASAAKTEGDKVGEESVNAAETNDGRDEGLPPPESDEGEYDLAAEEPESNEKEKKKSKKSGKSSKSSKKKKSNKGDAAAHGDLSPRPGMVRAFSWKRRPSKSQLFEKTKRRKSSSKGGTKSEKRGRSRSKSSDSNDLEVVSEKMQQQMSPRPGLSSGFRWERQPSKAQLFEKTKRRKSSSKRSKSPKRRERSRTKSPNLPKEKLHGAENDYGNDSDRSIELTTLMMGEAENDERDSSGKPPLVPVIDDDDESVSNLSKGSRSSRSSLRRKGRKKKGLEDSAANLGDSMVSLSKSKKKKKRKDTNKLGESSSDFGDSTASMGGGGPNTRVLRRRKKGTSHEDSTATAMDLDDSKSSVSKRNSLSGGQSSRKSPAEDDNLDSPSGNSAGRQFGRKLSARDIMDKQRQRRNPSKNSSDLKQAVDAAKAQKDSNGDDSDSSSSGSEGPLSPVSPKEFLKKRRQERQESKSKLVASALVPLGTDDEKDMAEATTTSRKYKPTGQGNGTNIDPSSTASGGPLSPVSPKAFLKQRRQERQDPSKSRGKPKAKLESSDLISLESDDDMDAPAPNGGNQKDSKLGKEVNNWNEDCSRRRRSSFGAFESPRQKPDDKSVARHSIQEMSSHDKSTLAHAIPSDGSSTGSDDSSVDISISTNGSDSEKEAGKPTIAERRARSQELLDGADSGVSKQRRDPERRRVSKSNSFDEVAVRREKRASAAENNFLTPKSVAQRSLKRASTFDGKDDTGEAKEATPNPMRERARAMMEKRNKAKSSHAEGNDGTTTSMSQSPERSTSPARRKPSSRSSSPRRLLSKSPASSRSPSRRKPSSRSSSPMVSTTRQQSGSPGNSKSPTSRKATSRSSSPILSPLKPSSNHRRRKSRGGTAQTEIQVGQDYYGSTVDNVSLDFIVSPRAVKVSRRVSLVNGITLNDTYIKERDLSDDPLGISEEFIASAGAEGEQDMNDSAKIAQLKSFMYQDSISEDEEDSERETGSPNTDATDIRAQVKAMMEQKKAEKAAKGTLESAVPREKGTAAKTTNFPPQPKIFRPDFGVQRSTSSTPQQPQKGFHRANTFSGDGSDGKSRKQQQKPPLPQSPKRGDSRTARRGKVLDALGIYDSDEEDDATMLLPEEDFEPPTYSNKAKSLDGGLLDEDQNKTKAMKLTARREPTRGVKKTHSYGAPGGLRAKSAVRGERAGRREQIFNSIGLDFALDENNFPTLEKKKPDPPPPVEPKEEEEEKEKSPEAPAQKKEPVRGIRPSKSFDGSEGFFAHKSKGEGRSLDGGSREDRKALIFASIGLDPDELRDHPAADVGAAKDDKNVDTKPTGEDGKEELSSDEESVSEEESSVEVSVATEELIKDEESSIEISVYDSDEYVEEEVDDDGFVKSDDASDYTVETVNSGEDEYEEEEIVDEDEVSYYEEQLIDGEEEGEDDFIEMEYDDGEFEEEVVEERYTDDDEIFEEEVIQEGDGDDSFIEEEVLDDIGLDDDASYEEEILADWLEDDASYEEVPLLDDEIEALLAGEDGDDASFEEIPVLSDEDYDEVLVDDIDRDESYFADALLDEKDAGKSLGLGGDHFKSITDDLDMGEAIMEEESDEDESYYSSNEYDADEDDDADVIEEIVEEFSYAEEPVKEEDPAEYVFKEFLKTFAKDFDEMPTDLLPLSDDDTMDEEIVASDEEGRIIVLETIEVQDDESLSSDEESLSSNEEYFSDEDDFVDEDVDIEEYVDDFDEPIPIIPPMEQLKIWQEEQDQIIQDLYEGPEMYPRTPEYILDAILLEAESDFWYDSGVQAPDYHMIEFLAVVEEAVEIGKFTKQKEEVFERTASDAKVPTEKKQTTPLLPPVEEQVNLDEPRKWKFEVPMLPVLNAWHDEEEKIKEQVVDKEIEEHGYVREDFEVGPEVAPATPMNVMMAILSAAALDFKLRKVPQEHKKTFESVSDMAASLARLTKLKENVIETVSVGEVVLKEQEEWKPAGKPIFFDRSDAIRIANEAAAMGKVLRRREKEVVSNFNFKARFKIFEEQFDVDEAFDEKGRKIFRTDLLLDQYITEHKQEKQETDYGMSLIEEMAERDKLMKEVDLPTPKLPTFGRRAATKKLSRAELTEALSKGVAEIAWDRRYRLHRPKVTLRVQSHCRCSYCKNANPFQTHAYKRLQEEQDQKKNLTEQLLEEERQLALQQAAAAKEENRERTNTMELSEDGSLEEEESKVDDEPVAVLS